MANVMRSTYRELTDEEKETVKALKAHGEDFVAACNVLGKSRELSLAITNVEQAVMWAVKHVTGPKNS